MYVLIAGGRTKNAGREVGGGLVMIEVQSKQRDIPIWLTGIVLILCIVGGGWLVRWYSRDAGAQAVEVPLENPATVAANAKFRAALPAAGGGGRAQRDGLFGSAPVDGV